MTTAPLMPKATAVWLVDNTSLSFDQIAQLCNLHPLEVKAIADGDAAQGIKGLDPILTGQLTREEIAAAEADPDYKLHIAEPKVRLPEAKPKKGPRYTPVSRRQDRPNAILWLVRNHAELKDSQIMRLVGTTKSTIQSIRERTHWNSANLTPLDPVTLGLCSQIDLDLEVQKAAKEKPVPIEAQGATLLPGRRHHRAERRARARAGQPEAGRRSQCRGGVRQAQAARRQGRVALTPIIAQHDAGAAGGDQLVAEPIEKAAIVVADADIVAGGGAEPDAAASDHDRLAIPDQRRISFLDQAIDRPGPALGPIGGELHAPARNVGGNALRLFLRRQNDIGEPRARHALRDRGLRGLPVAWAKPIRRRSSR